MGDNALGWSGIASIVLSCGLALLTWLQSRAPRRALRQALENGYPSLFGDYTPKAQIVLCLRGSDPFLDRCLSGLVHQDYPDYKVLIVVDTESDEVLPHVRELQTLHGSDRVEVLIRDHAFSTCTRKASSLHCAYSRTPDDVEVIATCDGDAITHPTWLRELVAPMKDPRVLASTGNRWYSPQGSDPMGLLRFYWNGMAVPSMVQYHIPWGGSLALRREVFRDPEYLDLLAHAFSEDTQLANFLNRRNTSAVPVIPLVMLNEERTSFTSFWGFLLRQMLAARLHHPAARWVFLQAMILGALGWICLPWTIYEGGINILTWVICTLFYGTVVQVLVLQFDGLVRKLLREWRGVTLRRYDLGQILSCSFALLFLGFYYPAAVLTAWLTRRHEWRGITYRIEPHSVAIVDEQEFRSAPEVHPEAPAKSAS